MGVRKFERLFLSLQKMSRRLLYFIVGHLHVAHHRGPNA
jgi:hypothetical protein